MQTQLLYWLKKSEPVKTKKIDDERPKKIQDGAKRPHVPLFGNGFSAITSLSLS